MVPKPRLSMQVMDAKERERREKRAGNTNDEPMKSGVTRALAQGSCAESWRRCSECILLRVEQRDGESGDEAREGREGREMEQNKVRIWMPMNFHPPHV